MKVLIEEADHLLDGQTKSVKDHFSNIHQKLVLIGRDGEFSEKPKLFQHLRTSSHLKDPRRRGKNVFLFK